MGCDTLNHGYVDCWLLGNQKAFYRKRLAAVEKPNIANIENLAQCGS